MVQALLVLALLQSDGFPGKLKQRLTAADSGKEVVVPSREEVFEKALQLMERNGEGGLAAEIRSGGIPIYWQIPPELRGTAPIVGGVAYEGKIYLDSHYYAGMLAGILVHEGTHVEDWRDHRKDGFEEVRAYRRQAAFAKRSGAYSDWDADEISRLTDEEFREEILWRWPKVYCRRCTSWELFELKVKHDLRTESRTYGAAHADGIRLTRQALGAVSGSWLPEWAKREVVRTVYENRHVPLFWKRLQSGILWESAGASAGVAGMAVSGAIAVQLALSAWRESKAEYQQPIEPAVEHRRMRPGEAKGLEHLLQEVQSRLKKE